MGVVVQDLVTKFSFLGSDKPLKEYNLDLGSSIKLLGVMYAGLNAAASAFIYWSDTVLTGVDSLDQLSKISNVSASRIQEWEYAAGQSQSTAAAMDSTIRSLSATIGSAAQKGSEDFARLGISVRDSNGHVKNADQILDEVRRRFVALNLSMQEQQTFASALGIDTSLVQLLNKTDQEMASLTARARELGTLTAEQTQQANDYKQSLNSMWFALNSVRQLVAIGVAPELRILADNFIQLLADNKEWVIDGIQFAIKWAGILLASFNRMLPIFAGIVAGFIASKIAALGFAGVMGIIFSPLNVVIGVATALYLILDDLIVAFQGGHSVIADFFQNAFDINIVTSLTAAFQFLQKYALEPLLNVFRDIWSFWQLIIRGITTGGAALAGLLGIGAGGSIPIGTGTGGAGGVTNNRIEQKVGIEIKTNDPLAAGRAVQDGLQRQLDNANTQLGIGGR